MFSIGQRWFSKTEPELGLATVQNVDERLVTLHFPAAQETRTYNKKSAPLQRMILQKGETAKDSEGREFCVEEIKENNGVLFYFGEGACLPETGLDATVSLVKPQERLLLGDFDRNELFNFRYESLLLKRALQEYEAKGLEGSRINLIGHQISIFSDVNKKLNPKLILADEVGLGKTIEAGLLAKSLLEKKLVKTILVITPVALQYQWFVEFYKKFDFLFKTLGAGDEDAGSELELSGKVENDDFIIANMKFVVEDQEANKLALEKEWDLLIVDEVHRYKSESAEFNLLKELTQKAKNALYLSATPEALGERNFFELLKVLNPQKYRSYEDFQKSEELYRQSPPTPELLEKYNYERDYFRNRRKNLESEKDLFATKQLRAFALEIPNPTDRKVIEAKVDELSKLLKEFPDRKVLTIGKSRKLAAQVQNALLKRMNVKTALFHGDQTLLERDRQAAYFADPEGAQCLISAESGSEGRNFEFASELFLLDLPAHPQLLLQRIGRLDRIGQRNAVTIHLPYVKGSVEENLFSLYHDVFDLFEKFPTGLVEFYESNQEEINGLLHSPNQSEKSLELARRYRAFQESSEKSKNAFLDAHSYKESNVREISEKIKKFHQERDIQAYLEKAFNLTGVDVEELSSKVYFVRPSNNMLIPSYPNLPAEGLSYTTSRSKALKRQDLRFMSFENPLFQSTMDLFLEGEFGNTSALSHQGQMGDNLFLEFIFKVEPKRLFYNNISEFFPLVPVRVLVDARGKDMTASFPKKRLDALARPLSDAEAGQLTQGLPKQAVLGLIEKAKTIAANRTSKYKAQALEKIERVYGAETAKLKKWGASNEFSAAELEKLALNQKELIKQTQELKIEIDSLRIIV